MKEIIDRRKEYIVSWGKLRSTLGTNMALNIGYLTSDKENNELYSPFYIVDHIMKYLPKDKVIWCPFDEEKNGLHFTFV